MSRKIIIELTVLETGAILSALSNTTDWEDAMKSQFPAGNERATCYRAVKKLREAYQKAVK